MKRNKKIITAALSAALVVSLAACGEQAAGESPADKGAQALNQIVEAFPDRQGFHEELQHWGFEVEAGEKFEWSKDMSANEADLAMVIKAEPLINAGLDIAKLDQAVWIYQEAGTDSMGMTQPALLILPSNIGDAKLPSDNANDSMKALLDADQDNIMYHDDMKHFVLALGGANEVIWTEQLDLNETDLAFVLAAEPLVTAGLDISKLEGSGWAFKEADDALKTPDQIIKTFDLNK